MHDALLRLYREARGDRPSAIVSIAGDGSQRTYHRLIAGDGSTLFGAFGPDHDENRAFLSFTRAFGSIDLPVPAIYAVDEATRTVSELWSYGEPSGVDSFFSSTRGNADWQATTGNIVMVSGNLRSSADVGYAQVLEVSPDGKRVFELNVGDASDSPVDTRSHSVYRVQRLADMRQ